MIFLPSISSELAAHFGMPLFSNKDEEYKMNSPVFTDGSF